MQVGLEFFPGLVPYDVCHTVPDIEFVRILKSVPELQCTPETYRECNDVETKVPYFEEEEQCEEVVFDECVQARLEILLNFNYCYPCFFCS